MLLPPIPKTESTFEIGAISNEWPQEFNFPLRDAKGSYFYIASSCYVCYTSICVAQAEVMT